ncbi:MAG: CDP-alcohol phosphatidyltransferase family protein [Clostridiales Family XIII bacterium]|jgi:CDP-diacylglycerol--serine O-phosphatidyltransferase|nr:CDP-alcohol phosphatidyltransferase family protein [Clostridiales Family XIII bacterium]
MKLIVKPQVSALLTYAGVAISSAGIFLAAGARTDLGLVCLIAAAVCDVFDGTFARRFERTDFEKRFGIQIDSLADVVNFVALPAVLLTRLMAGSPLAVPLIIFYAGCGITRLAVYNAEAEADAPKGYFRGVPIVYIALVLPVAYLAQLRLQGAAALLVVALPVVALALLYVLDIRVRRPGRAGYACILLLAVALSAGVLHAGV